jgi:hypothetical protein
MNRRRTGMTVLIVLTGLTIIAVSGCVTAKFTETVASFQENINKSSFIITEYYEKANTFERDVYISECLFNPEKELLLFDNGSPTPLLHAVLSPESVKARADALVLIGIYANRLSEIAGNDSPEVFRKNSLELGDNLMNLGKSFADLSAGDAEAMQYSGAVSKLIGVLGELYMESSRDIAVETAVNTGAPVVNKILNQLQNDLNDVLIPLQKTGLKQQIVEMSAYYNENRKKLTLTRRRTELHRINKVIAEYNILLYSNPANLIQEMKEVNSALTKYAESSGDLENFSEFVSALDRFNSTVQLFADGIKQFK